MVNQLKNSTAFPLLKRLGWVLFAILFYQCGLAFTTWVIEPEGFAGGAQWVKVFLFPVLVPLFFVVNGRLGCAAGTCEGGHCRANRVTRKGDETIFTGRMPGI